MLEHARECIETFEKRFPDCTMVAYYDHSSNHKAFHPHALSTTGANKNPGGSKVYRDTVWKVDGVWKRQRLMERGEDGRLRFIGLKRLVELREGVGSAASKLKLPELRKIVAGYGDFKAEKPMLQKVMEEAGHACVGPKVPLVRLRCVAQIAGVASRDLNDANQLRACECTTTAS